MSEVQSGNLTFVIDADTGRALQKLAQTASGMDNVKKKTKEVGTEADKSGKKLEQFAKGVGQRLQSTIGIGGVALGAGLGTGLATAAIALGEKIYQYYTRKAEEARKKFEQEIKEATKVATGAASNPGITSNRARALAVRTGLPDDVVSKIGSDILKANPGISDDNLAGYISTANSLNPTGPGATDLLGQMSVRGLPPGLAAGLIERSGNRAGDLATFAKSLKPGMSPLKAQAILGDYAGKLNQYLPGEAARKVNRNPSLMGQLGSIMSLTSPIAMTPAEEAIRKTTQVDSILSKNVVESESARIENAKNDVLLRVMEKFPEFVNSGEAARFREKYKNESSLEYYKERLIGSAAEPYWNTSITPGAGNLDFPQIYDDIKKTVNEHRASANAFERAAKRRSNEHMVDAQ